jgi:hypothetical protein
MSWLRFRPALLGGPRARPRPPAGGARSCFWAHLSDEGLSPLRTAVVSRELARSSGVLRNDRGGEWLWSAK